MTPRTIGESRPEPLAPQDPPRRPTVRVGLVVGYVGTFVAASSWAAVASRGFLEADGITHYLYARHALDHPWVFTDLWGRPLVKLLHVLPASLPGDPEGLPLVLTRLTSLAVALAGAWLAFLVAKRLPAFVDRPRLAWLTALGSPLVFLHSFSVLTELPFGLLCVALLLAYQRRQWWAVALLAGMMPAARPEGLGFVLLAALALISHRKPWWLALIGVGPAAWATAGWWINGAGGAWPIGAASWLVSTWPYSGESTYDSGPLLKFVGMWPAAVGPALMPLVLVGVGVGFASLRQLLTGHQARVVVVATLVPVGVLAVHSVLHWTGRMASSGDVRYLVAVWPLWGVTALVGFEAVARRIRIPAPGAVVASLAVVPTVMLQLAYPVVPLQQDEGAVAARTVARWYADDASADLRRAFPETRVDHPSFRLAAQVDPFAGGSRQLVRDRPPGVLFLWDEIYSLHNADAGRTLDVAFALEHGWRDATPTEFPVGWRVLVSGPYDRP